MTESTAVLQDEEADAWRELPFVRHVRKFESLNWEVPSLVGQAVDDDDKARLASQEQALGHVFAMELIAHIQAYPTFLPTRLGDVCEVIVKRGKWTSVEAGFFSGIGEYLATGRVCCHANGWTSRPERPQLRVVE